MFARLQMLGEIFHTVHARNYTTEVSEIQRIVEHSIGVTVLDRSKGSFAILFMPSAMLRQFWHNWLREAAVANIHYIQWHLSRIKLKALLVCRFSICR